MEKTIKVVLSLLFIRFSIVSGDYNVVDFGAKADGKTDSTRSFLNAWASACGSITPTTINVPSGRFLINRAAIFRGPCKNNATIIRIDGTLVSPSDYRALGGSGNWLLFIKVSGVSVYGGTLDGQGARFWACKKNCPAAARSLSFNNGRDILIKGLTSINSQGSHIVINGCKNVTVQGLKIVAPDESPNTGISPAPTLFVRRRETRQRGSIISLFGGDVTAPKSEMIPTMCLVSRRLTKRVGAGDVNPLDGIHVQFSTGVTITGTSIGTGDDCISIGSGTSNMWIEGVDCGPGHGISIGSLGKDLVEQGVQNVTVKNVVFTGTQNGLRIKSWPRPSNGFVRTVLYQDAIMENVKNPIIIDQNYCPRGKGCTGQSSGVKISQVTYKNIRGTSATQVAMKFDCSQSNPCTDIKLEDVQLTYQNSPAQSSCLNADGVVSGLVLPSSCI